MENQRKTGVEKVNQIRKSIMCLLIVSAFACSGCAYLENRVRDFGDIVYANVTVGWGVEIHAEATWLLMGGVKSGVFERYGYGFGEFIYTNDNSVKYNPERKTKGYGISALYYVQQGGPNVFLLFPIEFEHTLPIANPINPKGIDNIYSPDGFMDISIALHIVYFGFEFRFKLNELFDFILGLTTLDIRGDDNGKNGNPLNHW